jgi:hypothetical protein
MSAPILVRLPPFLLSVLDAAIDTETPKQPKLGLLTTIYNRMASDCCVS